MTYALRIFGASALLFLTYVASSQATLLAVAAMLLSLAGVGIEFWRGRAHYLDDSKWDEELVEA